MTAKEYLGTLDGMSRATMSDGTIVQMETTLTCDGDVITAWVKRESIPRDTVFLDFLPAFFSANEGADGYMVFPQNRLVYFKGHENCRRQAGAALLPIFGAKTDNITFVGIVTGDKEDSVMIADIEDGIYRAYPRFLLEGDGAPCDLCVEYRFLYGENADYSGMARCYREKRLAEGLRPIKDRVGDYPALKYALESPYIRIRMGWKPVPSPVSDQTRETEPPMFVACDCASVACLMDAMAAAGIKQAELCLVGWNVRGHDGRWPEAFPVEEAIGGEEGLRALIRKAQDMGYHITCHSNHSDAYTIADCFSEDILRKNGEGKAMLGGTWSGGNMYPTCPKATYDLNRTMLDRIAALGFSGCHYIDVIGVVPPKKCGDKAHPLTRAEDAVWNNRLFAYARERMGGIASEGAFDHMCDTLDYGLYVQFKGNADPLCDEEIPFWQLVYHGIVLQNPSTATVNYTIKGPDDYIEAVEFGARPSFYYYSRFVTESEKRKNWMGTVDMRCSTDEEREESVLALRRAVDEYAMRQQLQYCFMDKHEKLDDGIYRVVYSDGTQITVNRGENYYAPLSLMGKAYRIIKG